MSTKKDSVSQLLITFVENAKVLSTTIKTSELNDIDLGELKDAKIEIEVAWQHITRAIRAKSAKAKITEVPKKLSRKQMKDDYIAMKIAEYKKMSKAKRSELVKGCFLAPKGTFTMYPFPHYIKDRPDFW